MCWTKKTLHVLLSHLPNEHVCTFVSNAGNERRARREWGTVVQRSKPHMFFVSYMFSFPIMLEPPSLTKKQERKKTSFFSSMNESKEVGRRWGVEVFQNRASCSLCLVLFVCISFYSLSRPCMGGRKKDSRPTAFDVHVLWSHVSALSVKSFCCPAA